MLSNQNYIWEQKSINQIDDFYNNDLYNTLLPIPARYTNPKDFLVFMMNNYSDQFKVTIMIKNLCRTQDDNFLLDYKDVIMSIISNSNNPDTNIKEYVKRFSLYPETQNKIVNEHVFKYKNYSFILDKGCEKYLPMFSIKDISDFIINSRDDEKNVFNQYSLHKSDNTQFQERFAFKVMSEKDAKLTNIISTLSTNNDTLDSELFIRNMSHFLKSINYDKLLHNNIIRDTQKDKITTEKLDLYQFLVESIPHCKKLLSKQYKDNLQVDVNGSNLLEDILYINQQLTTLSSYCKHKKDINLLTSLEKPINKMKTMMIDDIHQKIEIDQSIDHDFL